MSRAAHDELIEAMGAKDVYGFRDLLNSGQVLVVQSGTKALVLDRTLYLVKVRILEGPHDEGRAGWVTHEAVD